MAKIRRNDKREMPALNTSSLPDIIFMLLFFFMSVTSMKEVTYKVQIQNPQATELTKLEKKSLDTCLSTVLLAELSSRSTYIDVTNQ